MQELNWSCIGFDELSPAQLYAVLQLRIEVFVVEQECVYQDMDDYDQSSLHVLGTLDNTLLCYARLVLPGVKYAEPSIGRVIADKSIRLKGYGRQTIKHSLNFCQSKWPDKGVRISAQQHLENFYQAFDFVSVSEPYLEDGIPHIEMFREPESISNTLKT